MNLQKIRAQEHEHQQRCCHKKTVQNSPAFKSSSSFGKAMFKAKQGLPKSPRKRSAIVQRLFIDTGCRLVTSHEILRHHIPIETKTKVTSFYLQPDVS